LSIPELDLPAFTYSFSHGGNKLFDLPLLKLQKKRQVKVGVEKVPDHLKEGFLGNALGDGALHAVSYRKRTTIYGT
jgi:hypothetical protein